MSGILKRIIEQLISKKKIVAWVSAALIPIIGVAITMDPEEIKQAICEVK